YTGTTYRYIDPGYPKPIAVELRKEPPFTQLPDTFEDDLFQDGQVRPLDAVVGNDRTTHLLVGGVCHTASPHPPAPPSLPAPRPCATPPPPPPRGAGCPPPSPRSAASTCSPATSTPATPPPTGPMSTTAARTRSPTWPASWACRRCQRTSRTASTPPCAAPT